MMGKKKFRVRKGLENQSVDIRHIHTHAANTIFISY